MIGYETTERDLIPIPRYDPNDQLGVDDLAELYPGWQDDGLQRNRDPELVLFDVVRTVQTRRIARNVGLSPFILSEAGSEGLERAMKQIPRDAGKHFQAHGIAGKSGSSSDELDVLLRSGISSDKQFYTTELCYNPAAGPVIGADMPFTQGNLVTVFGKDDPSGKNGIHYVLVGEQYVQCIDAMRTRYKDSGVTFLPWHDVAEFFIDLVNDEEGMQYATLLVDNIDTYTAKVNTHLLGGAGSLAPEITTYSDPVELVVTSEDGPDVW